ncbi:hypothetical protein [Roseimaritima ulvae]|uniref:Uncharacterized protein n=1 Tax=Roseimaritima ulvae TaxID=980254 RepID=A0A5B9QNW1_9BACT|nr:hypothetical protein [Roseimaritima ulvae]QEG40654.1 hypothetical protein UC8_26710 [Roseimaritima ulvae]
MDHAANTTGQQQFACAGFSVCATVDEPPTELTEPTTGSVYMTAKGPANNGNVSLKADGRVSSSVAQSHIDVIAGGVVVDAGDEGKVGMRVGSAPMMQHVELQGNGGNILLQNGQLPLAPKIEVTPDSIVLSVGANKITIGPTGIAISGLEIKAKAAAAVNVEGLETTIKAGVAATLQAGASTTIKGGIVMIN